MKKNIFLFLLFCFLLFSCSNKTDVKFMGVNLNSPCEEFLNNLEDNGFIVTTFNNKKRETNPDYPELKGKYLGKDVTIKMYDKVGDHYKEMMLTAIFTNDNDNARHFYKKICNDIEEEHSGFEKEDETINAGKTRLYYSKDKGIIKIMFNGASSEVISVATVVAIFDTGETIEEELPDSIEPLKIDDNE